MLSRLGLAISAVFRRTMPDPFVIAVLLTVLTFLLALALGDFPLRTGPAVQPVWGDRVTALLAAWRADAGLWAFLAFSMQMCLILVTGHALAETRPVRRVIAALADRPRSTAQAAAMVSLVACLAGLVNWGLGLIVGALLARETGRSLARRGIPAHYPLICAAGYTAMMVWHGGLSGSAPLSMTTLEGARKVLPEQYAATLGAGGVPLSQTTFSLMNLVITGGLLILTPLVMALLAPRQSSSDLPPAAAMYEDRPRPAPASERTIPDRLDTTPFISGLLALGLLAGVAHTIWTSATRAAPPDASPVAAVMLHGLPRIGLNEVNMLMLALGLLLHGSLRSYAAAVEGAMRGCAGILLQFPLYGGIMAMMVASGLVRLFAGWIGDIATPGTLPLCTYLSAAGLNLFIPSGGGQWGVQGPIALESAMTRGVPLGKMIMAVAYGDQLTNMLQPFWALPLLAITGVKAREIVGYTAVVMLIAGAWIGFGLLIL
ncbi:MAG: TIGR00366 family protein [Phycisphaerales bacterium]